MKAMLMILIAGLSMCVAAPVFAGAACTGSDVCTRCKNCSSCKYCAKQGGTCGVCKKTSDQGAASTNAPARAAKQRP